MDVMDFLKFRLYLVLGNFSFSTDTKKASSFLTRLRCVGGADGTFYLTLRAARPSACQAAKLSNRKSNQLNYRSNFLKSRLYLELGSIFIFDRYKKGIVFRQCLR
ncbi:hypothetical protein, partial [Aliivibrio fischeri]|uniref:hypothetical protein n=1 Tax=Aliivibrio fischeri TaxID=668 RepID=UPI001F491EF3